MFHLERLHLTNFRCFDQLDVAFEPDLTVFFAENAGGKTTLLTALAMAIALVQPRTPKHLTLNADRDIRRIRTAQDALEPAGFCSVMCVATIGAHHAVEWSVSTTPQAKRRTERLSTVNDAIEGVRAVGERWPLLGYYGSGRLGRAPTATQRKAASFSDRWDGYDGCLDPELTDGSLFEWLKRESLGNLQRMQRKEAPRLQFHAVRATIQRAIPGVTDLTYDLLESTVLTWFDDGSVARWSELSDGYHLFLALVGDIARRSLILNPQDGAAAPLLIEGVVLIDEIDLHLHPKWQRIALDGLRAAFPKLQFIVTTHSPQVLSSAKNHQVRLLVDHQVREGEVFVEGRDTNAILRELMGTDDRDDAGRIALRALYAAIDEGRLDVGREMLTELRARWGDLDPALIRAEGLLNDEG